MAAAGQVCLRNRHPMRPFAVPLGNGWARLVPPQSCTTVSLRVLHLAPVVAGLAAEQLAIVTEVAQYWIGKSHCPRHCSVCCQQSLPAQPEGKTRATQGSVHWRQRNDLAAALLEAVQRDRRLTDPGARA
jgi:hypothetical protein